MNAAIFTHRTSHCLVFFDAGFAQFQSQLEQLTHNSIRFCSFFFDELCEIVHHQMKLQITDKQMAGMIATNVNSERSLILRATPLFLKNIVMKLIFNAVGERKSCFTLSNLGVCSFPPEMEQHIERMGVVLGVQANAPYNVGLISYKDKMYLNFIRNIKEPRLERAFYEVLRDLGIRPIVESNAR